MRTDCTKEEACFLTRLIANLEARYREEGNAPEAALIWEAGRILKRKNNVLLKRYNKKLSARG